MTDNPFNEIRDEVGEWSRANFADQPAVNPLRGIDEEKGELVHSVLKKDQGIREGEDGVGDEAEKDALGDMFVYLCDYAYRNDAVFWDNLEPEEYGDDIEAWRDVVNQYARLVTADESTVIDIEVAVNDFLMALFGWSISLGHSFRECIELAWYDEVKDREWNSDYAE